MLQFEIFYDDEFIEEEDMEADGSRKEEQLLGSFVV